LWVHNIPVDGEEYKWLIWNYITYLDCGERYKDMIDHRSYAHNLKQLWN